MPSVTANGLDIGYEVHGAGPPLVLLHGATSSGREDFAAQVPLFSKAFRVYLPDARGHATTRWDAANGWTFAELVDDVAAFADAIGLGTFHLLGFSMGAMTALQFAVRWPERLRTLIVAGITHPARAADERRPAAHGPGLDRPERAGAGGGPGSAARPGPGRRRLAPVAARDRPRHRRPAAARRRATSVGSSFRRWSPSATGTCSSPVDHAWGLARQLPDARLLVAPDCPHEIVARRPALFNEACAEFYRSTEAIVGRRSGSWPPADRSAETEGGSL